MSQDEWAGSKASMSWKAALRPPIQVAEWIARVRDGSDAAEVARALGAAEELLGCAAAVRGSAYWAAQHWVRSRGPLVVGNARYEIAAPHVGRCLDATRVGHLLMTAVCGNFSAFLSLLVNDPYRAEDIDDLLDYRTRLEFFEDRVERLVRVPDDRGADRLLKDWAAGGLVTRMGSGHPVPSRSTFQHDGACRLAPKQSAAGETEHGAGVP